MNVLGHQSPCPWTTREKIGRALWIVVEALLYRPSPRRCHAWRLLLLRVFGAQLHRAGGPPPRVWPSARVHFPWNLVLHDGVMVGPRVRLYNLAPVTLLPGANISQDAHLCAGSHDYTRWDMPLTALPIVVGPNAWITTEVFVGPGVTIGELAVIGARSVVLHDQPPRMLCGGPPCRPFKPRPEPVAPPRPPAE